MLILPPPWCYNKLALHLKSRDGLQLLGGPLRQILLHLHHQRLTRLADISALGGIPWNPQNTTAIVVRLDGGYITDINLNLRTPITWGWVFQTWCPQKMGGLSGSVLGL